MSSVHQEHAKVFKALCDPKRLAILEQLRGGEKCACVLQEPMNLTQSGLSYHMKILCDSGLVTSRQEGKWTHYRLSETGRNKAVKLLLAITTPVTDQEGGCLSCDR
ncbi:MAG: metalloregulator ArsR/SmtB family transcription factor [Oscillospiraceae bacterium]|nr:metalloregulator ArsR/SmtB family transcription factor [Oscillospiraceae bacterium]